MPEEVSGTVDPEVDLNDDAVGSCYVRAVLFCSQPDNATENLSLRRRSRESSRVGFL